MCGILGVIVNNPLLVENRLRSILINQFSRGRRGGGIVTINKVDSGFRRFRVTNPEDLKEGGFFNYLVYGDRALIHHRLPTGTENKPKYNHPISNEDKTIFLIHNGILHNEKELYLELKDKHKFETLDKKEDKITDSELLVHLIEDYLNKYKDINKAIEHLIKKVEGSYTIAFILINESEKDIYLLKVNNPLFITKDENNNFYFSSEYPKGKKGLSYIRELGNGEFGKLTEDGYKKINKYKVTEYFKSYSSVWDKYDYDYSGYHSEIKKLNYKKEDVIIENLDKKKDLHKKGTFLYKIDENKVYYNSYGTYNIIGIAGSYYICLISDFGYALLEKDELISCYLCNKHIYREDNFNFIEEKDSDNLVIGEGYICDECLKKYFKIDVEQYIKEFYDSEKYNE